jgi:hypothetical protein
MPPTTVEPKVSLDARQQEWLKTMAAALQIKLGGPAPQAPGAVADADLVAKCKQIKAAVVPKVKDAIAADPSKKDKIKQLLEAATAQESKGAHAEALESLTKLTTTVKEALQKTTSKASPTAPSTRAETDPEPSSTVTAAPPTATTATTATTAPPPTPAQQSPPPSGPPTPVQEQTPPKSAEEEAYDKELKAVNSLVDALNKHAHKAHIAGELTAIGTEIGKADTAFKAKKYADAMKALAKAKETAGKAKGFADKYEAYAKKRAEAQFLTHAFRDQMKTGGDASGNPTYLDNQITAITDADNLANPPTRNYAAATTKVEGVSKGLKDVVTDWYVKPNTPKIQALKTGPTKTFLAKQIQDIEKEMAILTANISAGDYRKALLQGPKVRDMITAANETSSRRTKVDTQRVKAVTAIDGLKTFKALSTQMDDLNKRLKEVDDQASIENRQFENAVEALTKIEGDARALAKNGPAAETYAKDRQAADAAYQKLTVHKQAAAQKPLVDGIKTRLDRAAELAKDPANVAAAGAELKLAKQEIDAATKAFGEADAVGVVAGNASDAATGKKSLDALKISLAAAKKHKRAADFATELKALDTKVASAEKKLKDAATVPDAINEIKSIGDDLSKVIIQLTQQDSYAAERAALEARLKAVKALPEAKIIQANITPVETALKDADTQDKAHAFDKRAAAMVKARQAADLAEKTAQQSKTYNARQKSLDTAVKGSSLGAPEKKQVTDEVDLAAAQATALKYDEATKLLVKAETTFEKLQINGFAKQTPLNLDKIKTAAQRMMKNGSAKEIDKLIQALPDTTKHEVLKTLAKERYGIELKDETGDTATKSAKAMLDMMSLVPDDIVGNPSLKKVERRTPNENGGWYEPDTKSVVMKGRPGQRQQGFGAAIAAQLPADVEPDCQAKDAATPVDYFDFATLHELGHSVDDNLQFMASREGKSEFGNWRTYGGNIDPIVDAVAAHYKYNSTPEQKKAISDLIQGNNFTWPTPPAGTPADQVTKWNDAQQAVINWHNLAKVSNKVWWKQADINKIKIKVGAEELVFAEAYDRQWVSYDFAARKKGLTGYQFRAPGEWFAELYAGYRIGKLQSSHPAISWLSKLKV